MTEDLKTQIAVLERRLEQSEDIRWRLLDRLDEKDAAIERGEAALREALDRLEYFIKREPRNGRDWERIMHGEAFITEARALSTETST